MSNFCTNCGSKLKTDANFCEECGAKTVKKLAFPQNEDIFKKPSISVTPPQVNMTQWYQKKQKAKQAEQEEKAKKAAAKKKKRGGWLAILLVIALFLETAFGYPGFLRIHNTPPEPGIGGENKPSGTGTGGDVSAYEGNAVPIGKSEAVRLDVEKGVVVTAVENALYENTTLKVEPVESASDELLELEKNFRECGEYAFAAWEVDAGLEPDEYLPGEFKMEVDLAEFELSEDLYDCVCFYRYAGDGSLMEYSTERNGSVISFTSNQNSIIITTIVIRGIELAVIGISAGLKVGKYIVKRNAEKYYTTKPGEEPCEITGSSCGCDYKITFFASDLDPEFSEKVARLKEIEKAAVSAVEEDIYADADNIFGIFTNNKKKASQVDKILAGNNEYREIQKSIAAPIFIKKFSPIVSDAYNYLACTARVKMPRYCVEIYLKTGLDDLAYQVTAMVGKPYVEVNVDSELVATAETGGEKWDNLLLTMTHELFHICQANYHTGFFTNSQTFDEMAAVILESDAFEHYKEYGKIMTEPERILKEKAYWNMVYFPMDYIASGDSKSEINQQHGYCMGRFVDYLRDKVDSSITAKDLMESRSFAWGTNLSEPIKYCFKLSDDAMDSYYKAFVLDHNVDYDNRERISTAFSEVNTYIPTKTVYLDGEKAKIIETEFDGQLCVKYHKFISKLNAPAALLLVPDENFDKECPGAVLIPSEDYQRISKGVFMPAGEGSPMKMCIILECMGNEYKKGSNSSYTVYTMKEPAAPDLSVEGNKLCLKLPKADDIYRDGYAEGYRAVFSVDGEQKLTRLIKAKDFGGSVSFDLEEITGDVEGKVNISVYYVPVLEDSENSPVGPKSSSSNIEVQIGDTTPEIFDVSVFNGSWKSTETRYDYDITISGDEIHYVTYYDGKRVGNENGSTYTFTFDGKELNTERLQISQNCYFYMTFIIEDDNRIRIGNSGVAYELFTRIEK